MARPSIGPRRRACALTVAAIAALPASSLLAQTTATWLSPASGTWSNPANWSTNPTYPNDPTTDVLLSATGSPYTVTLNSPVSLNSLTGTSPDATLLIGSATLSLTNSLNLGPGSITLAGGTITGGTIASNLTATAGTLGTTTLAATLTVPNYYSVTLTPTSSLAPTGSIHLTGPNSKVYLGGSAGTLSGNGGEVVFDDASGSGTAALRGTSMSAATIGPNITVRTGLGSGTIGGDNVQTYTTIPFVNQGTISAETTGQIINLFANGLTNTGTIRATNNSTLRLWGTFSPTALSSISTTNGGIAYAMTGKVGPNTGTASYTLSAGHAVGIGWDSIFQHLTISSSDGTPLSVYPFTNISHPTPTGTGTLTACNVLAPISVHPGGTLLATGGTTLAGAITLDGATLRGTAGGMITGSLTATNGSSATIGTSGPSPSYITLSASTLTLAAPLASLGPVTLSSGSTLNLNWAPPTNAAGPISVTDSTVNINTPLTAAQFAPFANAARTRATLNVNATLTNTGSTIPLDANTGPLNILSSPTSAGYITGGTLGSAGGGGLVVLGTANVTAGPTPTLQDVTLAGGTLSVSSAVYAQARGTLTLSSAHVSLAPGSTVSSSFPTRLTVDTLAGTGDVSFDGTPNATFVNETFSTFSIPAGVTVRTGTNSGTVNASTIAGTISAQTPGQSIGLNSLSAASGTLSATTASTLDVFATTGVISFITATHTLSFGSWIASDGGTIHITTSPNSPATSIVPVTTLAATASVTLSGPTSSFPSLDTLATNNGSFTLTAGRSFTTQSNFTNTGTLTLGPSAAFKVTGALSNPGTISLTAATTALLVDYTGASPADAIRADLLAHRLTTSVPGAVIAYAEVSQLNATTYAGLPVDATTLVTKVTLPGDTNLDGQVTPDDYALLDRSLASHPSNAHWTDGDFNYDGTIDQQDYLLIDTNYGQAQGLSPDFLAQRESQFGNAYVQTLLTSVPEPTLLSPLCFLPFLIRRKNTLFSPPAAMRYHIPALT